MLVRRAEQSHRHRQSSNSALPTRWAHTRSKSEAITTRPLARWSSHIHRVTAKWRSTCCSSYTAYTLHCEGTIQLLRTYMHMWRSKQVDFRVFRSIHMRRNHTHCEAHLVRSARWSNSNSESSRWSDQLLQFRFVYVITWSYRQFMITRSSWSFTRTSSSRSRA